MRSLEALIKALVSKQASSDTPTEERENRFVCNHAALPPELGFVPHQVMCNYHVGSSGEHSNQAAVSMAHECVRVGCAVFC
jgi:hypothetical protein